MYPSISIYISLSPFVISSRTKTRKLKATREKPKKISVGNVETSSQKTSLFVRKACTVVRRCFSPRGCYEYLKDVEDISSEILAAGQVGARRRKRDCDCKRARGQ